MNGEGGSFPRGREREGEREKRERGKERMRKRERNRGEGRRGREGATRAAADENNSEFKNKRK